MRTARKNKQMMYYSLLVGETEEYIYDKDGNKIIDYVDEDGTEYYRVTGNTIPLYDEPVPFKASISFGGGEAIDAPFGISISDYDATVVTDNKGLPIDETSLIWYNSPITYKDDAQTIVNPKSADFTVAKVRPSLNLMRYALKAIVK